MFSPFVCQKEIFLFLSLSKCLIISSQPRGKKVSCGAHRMNANGASPMDPNEQRLTITQIINHPQYSSFNFFGDGSNDIAVIKVNGNFGCSAGKIWPACLPDKSVSCRHNFKIVKNHLLQRLTYEGWAKTTATGWGTLSSGGALPEKLQKVRLAPVSDQVCEAALGAGRINDDVMICAGLSRKYSRIS